MKKFNKFQFLLLILFSFIAHTSFAWDHSVDLGYGYSHDPNNSRYNNSGFLLSGDIYPIKRTPWTFWSINGGLGQWHSNAPKHQNLTTAAIALALRFYMFNIEQVYPTYLLASAGPAVMSDRHFGLNKQGSNLTFQLFGGLGVELNKFDVNLRMVHYSNAHLTSPDQGITVLYLLSIGYLF